METITKPWSYSGLDTFESCARRFYGQYETKKFPYVETPAMKEGNRVDQAFTLRLDRSKIALPPDLAKYETWCQKIEQAGTVHAQMNVSLTHDMKPSEFFGKQVWVRGKADIGVIGKTAATILDVKNGNPNYEKPLQLRIYSVGIFARYPEVQTVTAANIWLKLGGLGIVHTYTREHHLGAITADMYKRAAAIDEARRTDRWPATPSGLCKGFCPDSDCQHWKAPR